MAATNALIDTSIIVEHLRKKNKHTSVLYTTVNRFILHVSTVAEFELFVGATDPQKRQDVQKFCSFAQFFLLRLMSLNKRRRFIRHYDHKINSLTCAISLLRQPPSSMICHCSP